MNNKLFKTHIACKLNKFKKIHIRSSRKPYEISSRYIVILRPERKILTNKITTWFQVGGSLCIDDIT